jgi:hypothetical protein
MAAGLAYFNPSSGHRYGPPHSRYSGSGDGSIHEITQSKAGFVTRSQAERASRDSTGPGSEVESLVDPVGERRFDLVGVNQLEQIGGT